MPRSDVARALDLINEVSPELGEMVEAQEVSVADIEHLSVGDQEVLLKTTTVTLRATYTGILQDEGEPHPYLTYSVYSRRANGQSRWFNGAVYVLDPGALARLQREFRPGDGIEITLETDWADPTMPTTLISFAKVEVLNDGPQGSL